MVRISTIAVPLSGNRGSASMLASFVQHAERLFSGNVQFNVYTYYPNIDSENNRNPNVNIMSGTPLNVLVNIVPVSFIYFLFRTVGIRLPSKFLGKEVRTLLESDMYLAMGGTTFNDAKLLKVVFNVLCLLPALFLGRKLVLFTQTMGPFKNPFNRVMAKLVLPHATLIVGRGKSSFNHLVDLGLNRVACATDAAFCLEAAEQETNGVRDKFAPLFKGRRVVGIAPNSIVEDSCRRCGIDHALIYGNFINNLIARGFLPVIIPHSMKTWSRNRHNNDIPVVEAILKHVDNPDSLLFVTDNYSYVELRALIGMTDYFVASRFHSMISALRTKRPLVVFGWGYQKYSEVMGEFELGDCVFSFDTLSSTCLIDGFNRLLADEKSVVERIERNLPRVIESSRRAIELVCNILDDRQQPISVPAGDIHAHMLS